MVFKRYVGRYRVINFVLITSDNSIAYLLCYVCVILCMSHNRDIKRKNGHLGVAIGLFPIHVMYDRCHRRVVVETSPISISSSSKFKLCCTIVRTREEWGKLELGSETFNCLNITRVGPTMLFDNTQIGFVVIFYIIYTYFT